MARLAFAAALVLAAWGVAVPASVSAEIPQAATKAAPPPAPAPPVPAKFYRPVKGIATIEVLQGPSKRAGANMVTVVKVKNTSAGRIDLLQIDEYWYDTNSKHVSGSMQKYRKPFNPGDIIEITLTSPVKPKLYRNLVMFSHAHGKIEAKPVKKFN